MIEVNTFNSNSYPSFNKDEFSFGDRFCLEVPGHCICKSYFSFLDIVQNGATHPGLSLGPKREI